MVQSPHFRNEQTEAWRVQSVQSQTILFLGIPVTLMMPKHPASQMLCFLLSHAPAFSTYSTHSFICIVGFGSPWQDGLVSSECQGTAPPIWSLYPWRKVPWRRCRPCLPDTPFRALQSS